MHQEGSQTTDTQWEDNLYPESYGISQLNYLKLQRRHTESLNLSPTTAATSVPPILSSMPPIPIPTPGDLLAVKLLDIIKLHSKEIEEDIRRQVEGKVETEVDALRARIDLLCVELHSERRWICTLEQSLKENNISFPSYPRN